MIYFLCVFGRIRILTENKHTQKNFTIFDSETHQPFFSGLVTRHHLDRYLLRRELPHWLSVTRTLTKPNEIPRKAMLSR